MKLLSRSEEMLLLAVWRLQDNAYGVTIRQTVKKMTGQEWSFGALHITLDRLVQKRLLDTHLSRPTQKRGGRSKRMYRLKPEAFEALKQVHEVQKAMWSGIGDLQLNNVK